MVPLTLTINTVELLKAKEAITNLLKQTADNSIVKSGAFQKMEKQKSDINFLASMEAIPATYRNQISMGLPTEVKAEDINTVELLKASRPPFIVVKL